MCNPENCNGWETRGAIMEIWHEKNLRQTHTCSATCSMYCTLSEYCMYSIKHTFLKLCIYKFITISKFYNLSPWEINQSLL